MGEAVKRDQTAHERLIPLLVEIVGARSYLELGTHQNQTISKVVCERRYGVDTAITQLEGVTEFFQMTTEQFIATEAERIAPIDFLFHDASHSADDIRRDIQGMWGFLSPEAVVAIHDTNPQHQSDVAPGFCGDAWKVPLFCALAGLEAVTLPFHPGLTIIRKRVTWGPAP